MLRNLLLLIAFWLAMAEGSAQYTRVYQDVFPTFGNYHRRGWVFSPSLNYTLPNLKEVSNRLWIRGDSVYDVTYNPSGRVGFGFEFGRFHLIDRSRLISHVELNMGLKILHGAERFDAVLDVPDGAESTMISDGGSFDHGYATMSFAASHIKQFSRTSFLQNTLGINGDYRVFSNFDYNRRGLPIELSSPSRFIFQAHYQLGFGFKVDRNIIIIPSIETPILTFYEYDDLKSTLAVFNSRYRPIIFRLNILMMDKRASRKCPSNKPKRKTGETLFGSTGNQPW